MALERTRKLMDEAVLDSLVTGFERRIPALKLPHDNDRHVLAAAIHCGAQVIVTLNLKHFPSKVLRLYRIKAEHPDIFVSNLLAQAPDPVLATVRAMRTRLKNPPKTSGEFLETLEAGGLIKTAAALCNFEDRI